MERTEEHVTDKQRMDEQRNIAGMNEQINKECTIERMDKQTNDERTNNKTMHGRTLNEQTNMEPTNDEHLTDGRTDS